MKRLTVVAFTVACGGAAQTPTAAVPAPVSATSCASAVAASAAPSPVALDATWGSLRELVGSWGGEDGPSKGTVTIAADLGGKTLVRRGTNDSPRGHHEDLTVFFAGGEGVRADYFDNEGHVIRYAVTPSADGKHIVFLSDEVPGAPRFRLTYDLTTHDDLGIVFEIAAPGSTEFKRFTGGIVHRR